MTTYANVEAPLKFREWQATAKLMPVEEGAAALDISADFFDSAITTDLLVYDGGCYIECLADGSYYLQISNSDWQAYDLERLERILYKEWYIQ
jgi:hypothetical protein